MLKGKKKVDKDSPNCDDHHRETLIRKCHL